MRGPPVIGLLFELPELQKVIESIRQRNTEKGTYGGGGWANCAAAYFNDCDRFFEVRGRNPRLFRCYVENGNHHTLKLLFCAP